MSFDLVIKNGMIVDGSGGARYRGDIGVKNGRIATIGRISAPADDVVDAEGHVVTPGLSMATLIWMHKFFGIA